MGRCCLGEWSTGCRPGSPQVSRKATTRYLCVHYTTQLLYQGARKQEQRGQKSCLQVEPQIFGWSARSRVWSPSGQFAFHVFNPAVMTVQCSVPILKPFACKLCTLWQILHDRALKNVEDFSSLFDLGTLPFGNIAHGKNRSYIKKKCQLYHGLLIAMIEPLTSKFWASSLVWMKVKMKFVLSSWSRGVIHFKILLKKLKDLAASSLPWCSSRTMCTSVFRLVNAE